MFNYELNKQNLTHEICVRIFGMMGFFGKTEAGLKETNNFLGQILKLADESGEVQYNVWGGKFDIPNMNFRILASDLESNEYIASLRINDLPIYVIFLGDESYIKCSYDNGKSLQDISIKEKAQLLCGMEMIVSYGALYSKLPLYDDLFSAIENSF